MSPSSDSARPTDGTPRRAFLTGIGLLAATAATSAVVRSDVANAQRSPQIRDAVSTLLADAPTIHKVIVVPSDIDVNDAMRTKVDFAVNAGQAFLGASKGVTFRVSDEPAFVIKLPIDNDRCAGLGDKLSDYLFDVLQSDQRFDHPINKYSAFWMGNDGDACATTCSSDQKWDGLAVNSQGFSIVRMGEQRQLAYGNSPRFFGAGGKAGSAGAIWLHETLHLFGVGHVIDADDIMNAGWLDQDFGGHDVHIDRDNRADYWQTVEFAYANHLQAPKSIEDLMLSAAAQIEGGVGSYVRTRQGNSDSYFMEFSHGASFWSPGLSTPEGTLAINGSMFKAWQTHNHWSPPNGPATYRRTARGIEAKQSFEASDLTVTLDPRIDVMPPSHEIQSLGRLHAPTRQIGGGGLSI